MILNDKSIFLVNDKSKKIWTLNSQSILKYNEKRKEIMVSDFSLL